MMELYPYVTPQQAPLYTHNDKQFIYPDHHHQVSQRYRLLPLGPLPLIAYAPTDLSSKFRIRT